MKISQKIILGIFIVIGLTAIAGYVCIRINKNVLEENIKAYSATQAAATLDAIDLKIQSRIEQVETFAARLSHNPEMKEYNNSFTEMDDSDTYIQQIDQQWQSDYLKGQSNNFVDNIQNNHISKLLNDEFELNEFYKEKYGYPIWGEIFITNKYGVNIAQCHMTSDYYQADESWWIAAKEKGSYISDIDYDDSASIYSIAICKSINDEAGNFLGVIKTVLNIQEALAFLEHVKKDSLFESLDFKLITHKGEMLSNAASIKEKPNPVIEKHISDFIKNPSSEKFEMDNEKMYVFTHSKLNGNFDGPGLILIVEYQVSEVFASVIELKNFLLTLLLIVSGFSITIAGLFVRRYVSVPIKKLIDASNKIGEGNLDTHVDVNSKDELGTLSQSFNMMAENLKKITDLEDQRDQEIVARKGLEKKLWDSNELFEAFMSTSIFAIAIIDKNHKIIRANPLFAEYFEKPVESFVGKYCYQESEKRNSICQHCPGIKAMESGKTEEVETKGIRDDGSHFDARICAIPYFNSDNEVAGFIEIVENTTQRNKEREALLQSEERFKQVAETNGDWIWEVNAEGLFIYASPVVENILGYTPDEIVGKKYFYEFFAPDNKEVLMKEASEILNRKESFKNFINSNIHKNGETVILETTGAPIIDKNGNLCGFRGTDRDITERINWEKQLQQTQEELIEASRKAGMSEVAADILHNVGNVLNSINVTTNIIKKTISNSEVSNLGKVVDMIEKQLGNLDSFFENDSKGKHIPPYLTEAVTLLTNEQKDIIEKLNILIEDINHIKTIINMQQECTKISGAESTVNINQVIENAIRINQASLKRHKIRLVKDCTDIGEININKNSVIQILVNLIANAKNALLESEVVDKVLTIRSYRHDNDFLRIEVIDNGIGISKENLPKLFQHGFTTRKEGHGFGLHSSVLAAQDMNGTLAAHSDGLGQGATFTLELPVKLVNACWIDEKPVAVS